MCGIAGYIGFPQKMNVVIDALQKLEYRGYDSAGIAFLNDGKITVTKSTGNISAFKKKVDLTKSITCAISHTRWATHGEVCEKNAHPHMSANKKWAVVHNGIIENYLEIKNELKTKPTSQTDTAVVSQLLEEECVNDVIGFVGVFEKIKGSYAIAALCNNKNNTMFLAKNNSPLYVSKTKEGFVVASDLVCFGKSKKYYDFEDHEYAIIENNKIMFFDKNKNKIKKTPKIVCDDFECVTKNEHKHFMIKEIFETENAIKNQIEYFKKNQTLEQFSDGFLNGIKKIKFIGCGTAYHAGLVGAHFVREILKIESSAEVASEFIFSAPEFVCKDELYVFVSQSGETADTLRALEIVKNKKIKFISLTNVLHSRLSKNSKYILPVCAGTEIAVASTKAYVCQLTALYMFCLFLKNQNDKMCFANIENLANKILKFDRVKIEKIAQQISTKNEVVFVGKILDFVTAAEASLKLKEISYINSFEFMAGELKHGYLALIEKGTPIFVFATNEKTFSKTMNAASEAESRGAELILITNQKCEYDDSKTIFLSEENSLLCAALAIVPMQYLAYRVSVLKNINPDQPRNLAKSVTVE